MRFDVRTCSQQAQKRGVPMMKIVPYRLQIFLFVKQNLSTTNKKFDLFLINLLTQIMSSSSKVLLAIAALVVGVAVLVTLQLSAVSHMEPIGLACAAGASDVQAGGYHPFEGRLGGTFVCIITQFLYDLTLQPAGFFVWTSTILAAIPACTLMGVESGRDGAKGLVRLPYIFTLLGQYIGISVIFTALWVPSCLYGGTTGGEVGALTPNRAYASGLLVVPYLLGTIFVFGLDPTSYAWTFCAGCLGGPIAGLAPFLLWALPPPNNVNSDAVARGCFATANVHMITGIIGFVGWIVVVYATTTEFGFDMERLWNEIWVKAHPFVFFMTLDAGGLFAGTIIYICSISFVDAVVAILLTPLLGPGTSCSLVLAKIEVNRGEQATKQFARKTL